MLLILSGKDGVPVYEQIADAIKQQLFDGVLQYGDELPPVRTLADSLNVNMHTARHAYEMLKNEGLVTMRLGQRTRIRSRPEITTAPESEQFLRQYWNKFKQEAFLRGVEPDQLKEFIEKELGYA